MSTIILVRHGEYELLGTGLKGRAAGIHLNPRGQAQAARVAEQLAGLPVRGLYSSPMERARETAEPIANRLAISIEILPEVTEIDYGDWTGREVREMPDNPLWKRFHAQRARTLIPGGEGLVDVQTRMVKAIESLTTRHPDETVVVVSHGDPIRSALCLYLGMPLDFIDRLQILPASISILELREWGPVVRLLNDTGDLR